MLLVSAVIAIPVVWLWFVDPIVRRRRDRMRSAARRQASASELLAEAKNAVRSEGWQRFATGQAILSLESTCTENGLHASLKALWEEVCDEDHKSGRFGRESNYFELYDCGIAALIEELQQRAGGTNLTLDATKTS